MGRPGVGSGRWVDLGVLVLTTAAATGTQPSTVQGASG